MEEIEPIEEERFDVFLRELPGQITDFLMDNRERPLRQLIQRLFFKFQDRTFLNRERTIEGCGQVLNDLTLAHQYRLAKLLADPLLLSFAKERDPKILRDMASLLHRMGTHLIQFADYPLASRLFLRLHQRYQQLTQGKDANAPRFAKILDRRLDPAIQKQVWDDIKSGEPAREQNAALLLGSLGRVATALFVDLIKKAETLRLREMGANLLRQTGAEAADLVKKELILSSSIEEKIRILDVLDTITRDLKVEINLILRIDNPELRAAAFRLIERLNNSQSVEILVDYIQNHETEAALQAIESFGRLKPALAAPPLIALLQATKEKDWIIACCRALGQLGDPSAIDPLARVLSRKTRLFPRNKRIQQIRAAAAFALAQIHHLRATQVLASFAKDRDPLIREISRSRLAQAAPSVVVKPMGTPAADTNPTTKASS